MSDVVNDVLRDHIHVVGTTSPDNRYQQGLPARWDETTQNYLQNRTEKGKSKRDVIRCLKRYLAREIFTILKTLPDQYKNPAQHELTT